MFSGTVFENIAYGLSGATREDVINAAKLAGAHEFISNLENGYDTYVGERGVKLSGGQKQRISIARVFLKKSAYNLFLTKRPPHLIMKVKKSCKTHSKNLQKAEQYSQSPIDLQQSVTQI